MREKSKSIFAAVLAVAFPLTSKAEGAKLDNVGAQIDESQLCSIFVSPSQGNNSYIGSAEKPFLTIEHALELANNNLRHGIGTRIVLQPGIYRERGLVFDGKNLNSASKAPLVIESSADGGVDWRGSSICTEPECVDPKIGLYRIPWNRSAGDTELSVLTTTSSPFSPQHLIPKFKDGGSTVDLQWDPPLEGTPSEYYVFRETTNIDGALQEKFHLIAPTYCCNYTDPSLPPINSEFRYQVVAIDVKGNHSPPSNVARASWILRFIPNTLGRRTEMLFIDGRMLQQVSRKEELMVGTFWVDDGNPFSDKHYLYFQTHSYRNPGTLNIEVAGGRNIRLITIQNYDNLVVRGITFSQAPTRSWNDAAVVIQNCHNVVVEKNVFSENNDQGLLVTEINHLTVKDNLCVHNGGGGIGGNSGSNQIWVNNKCSDNGWRSTDLGGQDLWFSAGIKHGFGLRHSVFCNNVTENNSCMGFWLDTDMKDILIENLSCNGNARSGMWLEGSRGPCVVQNSSFRGNGYYGILLGDAGGVTLENNQVENNFPAQICIAVQKGMPPGRSVRDRDDGKIYQSDPRAIVWVNNSISAWKTEQMLVDFAWGNLEGYQIFLDNLHAHGNHYWHPSKTRVFASPFLGQIFKITLEEWSHILGKGSPQDTAAQNTRWQRP